MLLQQNNKCDEQKEEQAGSFKMLPTQAGTVEPCQQPECSDRGGGADWAFIYR